MAFETSIAVCAKVFDKIKEQFESEEATWTFLGESVCLKAWKVLHGIGFLSLAIVLCFCFLTPGEVCVAVTRKEFDLLSRLPVEVQDELPE